MFLTQSNILRHLTKAEYELISEMCHYSNNLYNSAVYEIRQHYFETNKYLSYEKNDKICKLNENYKLLQAGVSQQILKVVDRSFKSFFALLNKAKTGNYDKKVRLPYYREKGGMFNLILSTNAINVDEKTNTLRLPMSRTFSKKHDKPVVKIPIPERLKGKEIKEVRIIPVYKGNHFKIQYIYKEETQPQNLNCDNKLAIDLGVDNLATCVTDKGTSFIMDGRKIKSINQYWNKRKAKLQSVAMKQKLKTTKQLCNLTRKRNSRIVNGACNILRKSKQNFDFEELCRGLLASPLRIQVS